MRVENYGYLRRRILMISLLLTLSAGPAFAQATSFTYQGRLTDGGTPANGTYDLQFALWDSNSGGTLICTIHVPNVAGHTGPFTPPPSLVAGAPSLPESHIRIL